MTTAACDYQNDKRIVLTLDAGGSGFRFNATRGGKNCVETVILSTRSDDLKLCLGTITQNFKRVRAECPKSPMGISHLGMSAAIALGAFAFAIQKLDTNNKST